MLKKFLNALIFCDLILLLAFCVVLYVLLHDAVWLLVYGGSYCPWYRWEMEARAYPIGITWPWSFGAGGGGGCRYSGRRIHVLYDDCNNDYC